VRAVSPAERQLVERAVARLRVGALAVVGALFAGVALWLATAWLVLRGGPVVGPHLGLLRIYMPGYSVSWSGACLGFGYGTVLGGVSGAAVAWLYNLLARRFPGGAGGTDGRR
jgi:hypothetical protein